MIQRTIILSLWLSLAVVGASRAGDLLPSWKQVYDELSSGGDVVKPPFGHFWTNSATIRKFVVERNTDALLELAAQPEHSLARLSAYFALRSLDQKSALSLGLEIALTTSVITNPLVIHVIEAVAMDLPTEDSVAALTRAFSGGPLYSANAQMVVSLLPEKPLRDWFEDKRRHPSLLTYEALVLNRLYLEFRKRRELPTPKMTNALEKYVFIPGIPRMTFVVISDDKHPLFKQALRLCLEDESLAKDALVPLVEVRASFIDKNIDVGRLNASKTRLQVITNVLGRSRRIDFPKK